MAGLFAGTASEENTGLYAVVGVDADVDGAVVVITKEAASRGGRLLPSPPPVSDFFRPIMDAAEVGCKVCAMGCRQRGRDTNGFIPLEHSLAYWLTLPRASWMVNLLATHNMHICGFPDKNVILLLQATTSYHMKIVW